MSRIGIRRTRQRLDTVEPKELLPPLLRSGAWQLRHADWRSYALLFAIQAITELIALPGIRWMLIELLS